VGSLKKLTTFGTNKMPKRKLFIFKKNVITRIKVTRQQPYDQPIATSIAILTRARDVLARNNSVEVASLVALYLLL
jgi:hypothetical protein